MCIIEVVFIVYKSVCYINPETTVTYDYAAPLPSAMFV